MLRMPYEQIIERIQEKSGLSEDEITSKITQKKEQLSGLVSDEGAAHIIANEYGVALMPEKGLIKIKNLLSGMRNVEVAGRVVAKFDINEFTSKRGPGKIGSFILGDETGTIRVALWNDQADLLKTFDKDDIVQIKSAYIRNNNGRLEVHVNDSASLEVNPEGVTIERVDTTPKRVQLKDITENMQNIEVLATIVQVYSPRFFEVCPECSKRARQNAEGWACETHGQVEPQYNYVLNAFLDDGTDNIRAVFFRNQVQHLLDMDHEEVLKLQDDQSFEPVNQDLLGRQVKIKGRVQRNQMFDRLELVAQIVEREPQPEEELQRLSGDGVEEPEPVFEDMEG